MLGVIMTACPLPVTQRIKGIRGETFQATDLDERLGRWWASGGVQIRKSCRAREPEAIFR